MNTSFRRLILMMHALTHAKIYKRRDAASGTMRLNVAISRELKQKISQKFIRTLAIHQVIFPSQELALFILCFDDEGGLWVVAVVKLFKAIQVFNYLIIRLFGDACIFARQIPYALHVYKLQE